MSKRLRIVTTEGGEIAEASFADAARAALEQMLADGVTVLLLVAETPDERLKVLAVPNTHAVVRGLYELLGELLYPEPE